MHDLPIRASLCYKEGDAAFGVNGSTITHPIYDVQTRNKNRVVGQYCSRVLFECRTLKLGQKCILEIVRIPSVLTTGVLLLVPMNVASEA